MMKYTKKPEYITYTWKTGWSTETSYESDQMSRLIIKKKKHFKMAIINMFLELEETMIKEINKSVMTMHIK